MTHTTAQLSGSEARLVSDLEKHFCDRLRKLMDESADVWIAGDLSPALCTAIFVAALGKELSYLTLACGGDEDAIVTMLRHFFSRAREARQYAERGR